jgi:hypothetical protein
MPTEPRRQSQDLILTCAEPQYRAAQEHVLTRSFRPTAISTTTFTDANVDVTAVGCYVIPEDGNIRGMIRRVLSVAGTVATIDAPWPTPVGNTAIRAWDPSDVPVRVTTASAAAIISTTHAAIANEPDNYWAPGKGYYAIGMSGANAGKAFQLLSFTSSTGTFTPTAALPITTAVGDLFLIRKVIRPAADVTASIKAKSIARKIIGTGSQGGDMPIVLANDGTISMDIEGRPLTVAAASGIVATPPIELGDIIGDHFNQLLNTGGTVSAIDANTITMTAAVPTVNGAVLLNNGKVAPILSATGANITKYAPGTAGFASVTVGTVAYASASYTRKTANFFTRLWELYRGGKVAQVFDGCVPTLTIDVQRLMPVHFKLAYTAGESLQWNVNRPVALGAATNPISIPDVGVPTDGKGSRVCIDGTFVNVISLSVNVGLKPVPRMSLSGLGQMDGLLADLTAPTGTMKIYADNDDIAGFTALMDRMQNRVPMAVLYQKGTAPRETFWIFMPTLVFSGEEFGYDAGQGVATIQFECVSPEAAVDQSNAQLFPTATYPGLSELSFGWC